VEVFWEACEQWANAQLKLRRRLPKPPKKGLQTVLEAEVVQEVEALLGREAVAELDSRLWKWLFASERWTGGTKRLSSVSSRPFRCGRFAGGLRLRQASPLCRSPAKQVQSVLGGLRLERAYYHCSSCGHGFCPAISIWG